MRKAMVFGALALLAPTLRAQRQETGLAVQSWKYDHETHGQFGDVIRGVLALELVNLSGKDITAYNISITLTYADGSTDYTDGRPNTPGEHMEDLLGALIIAEMSGKEPHKDQPNGIIAAGTTRSLILPQAKDLSDVKAVVDMVIYADSTAEVQNERAFKQLVAVRKGSLMATQTLSEAIRRVLEDATITNPGAAVVEELKGELAEAEKHRNPENAEGDRAVALRRTIANMETYQQPNLFSKKGTERDQLKQYVDDLDKRIALLLPHTQIKVIQST